jgi:hypothetical protein
MKQWHDWRLRRRETRDVGRGAHNADISNMHNTMKPDIRLHTATSTLKMRTLSFSETFLLVVVVIAGVE